MYLMSILFTLEKCKTKAGYAAKLPSSRKLNLALIKQQFEVVLETPILLVIREQGLEIVVHGYGELLFKDGGGDEDKRRGGSNDQEKKELMRKIAEKVYTVGLGK